MIDVASIPTILRKGAQWFADLGVKGSGGMAIFSMSGHVEKPGNYELQLGIPPSHYEPGARDTGRPATTGAHAAPTPEEQRQSTQEHEAIKV